MSGPSPRASRKRRRTKGGSGGPPSCRRRVDPSHVRENGMTKPPPELLEFLYRYDPGIQSLALGLRRVIHEEMAPCHEYIFEMRSKVVLLYGATERVIATGICNIGVFARH